MLIHSIQIDEFALILKRDLQPHYEVISELLAKSGTIDDEGLLLEPRTDRQIFYIFCALMRIRNKNYFSWWTAINTAAYQGKSHSNITSFFGITMLPYSLNRKLKTLITSAKVMEIGRATWIASGTFGLNAMDNSQFKVPMKYQRQGMSSFMAMFTTRCGFKCKQLEEELVVLRSYVRPVITYLAQAIPPAVNMPPYHLHPHINAVNLEPQMLPEYINSHNHSSGACMDAYAKRFEISQVVSSFRKLIPHHGREGTDNEFKFQNADDVKAMFESRIPEMLDKNRTPQDDDDDKFSYYKWMSEFPHRATVRWRGETEKASILVQPLSKMDETTNKGAGVVLISQLVMFGILKLTGDQGTEGNLNDIELEDGWEERTMMFVGDGLTMARMKSFDELLNTSCMGHAKQYEKALMLRKAMSRVVVVTGDLHGCFHFLMSVYSLFYGSLIQPIQTLLKWKRIKGSDITTCYQMAAGLALMTNDEIEKRLVARCIREIERDPEAIRTIRGLNRNRKEIAIFLAKYYIKWLEKKRKTTTDEVFRMTLNYVTLMHMYKNMVVAVRSGDSIMIEYMYVKFLPIFEASGKRNYVEIVCTMIESLYATIEPKILHLVRLNRTFPLYTGRNANGNIMAHKAIDDHVEGQQPGYATLGTNPENASEFCEASVHVTFYKKAAQFANIQYYRYDSKAKKKNAKTDEIGKNKIGSIASNRSKEKMAIAEFISLISATTEISGRVYSQKEIWDVHAQTTVELKGKKDGGNLNDDGKESTIGIDRLACDSHGGGWEWRRR